VGTENIVCEYQCRGHGIAKVGWGKRDRARAAEEEEVSSRRWGVAARTWRGAGVTKAEKEERGGEGRRGDERGGGERRGEERRGAVEAEKAVLTLL